MLVAAVLAVSLCTSTSFPPAEERTDQFWAATLTKSLHECYGHLDPALEHVDVFVEASPYLVSSGVDATYQWRVTFDTSVVQELVPEEMMFLLGHEAAHLAITFGAFWITGAEETEYAADLIGARSIPSGSCFGAHAIGWLVNRIPHDLKSEIGDDRANHRRKALIAQCAVEALAAKTPQ